MRSIAYLTTTAYSTWSAVLTFSGGGQRAAAAWHRAFLRGYHAAVPGVGEGVVGRLGRRWESGAQLPHGGPTQRLPIDYPGVLLKVWHMCTQCTPGTNLLYTCQSSAGFSPSRIPHYTSS